MIFCIDPSVQIVTKYPKVGHLLIFFISLMEIIKLQLGRRNVSFDISNTTLLYWKGKINRGRDWSWGGTGALEELGRMISITSNHLSQQETSG
jgi:hypothetical protein